MQRDPIVMRTRSILLIRDAVRQVNTVDSSGTADNESVRPND